jgi:hypothetical protein
MASISSCITAAYSGLIVAIAAGCASTSNEPPQPTKSSAEASL